MTRISVQPCHNMPPLLGKICRHYCRQYPSVSQTGKTYTNCPKDWCLWAQLRKCTEMKPFNTIGSGFPHDAKIPSHRCTSDRIVFFSGFQCPFSSVLHLSTFIRGEQCLQSAKIYTFLRYSFQKKS